MANGIKERNSCLSGSTKKFPLWVQSGYDKKKSPLERSLLEVSGYFLSGGSIPSEDSGFNQY